ncbi:MAG: preprotein translocase subunit SecA [Chloroflexi bacterium]|nr:preprotein translocase subunit SecA [Chloroflexota bacterium]
MLKGLARLIGGSNEGVIKKIKPEIEQINILEPEFEQLSDEQLREKTDEFKARLKDGEELDDLLYEAFAIVREAAKRTLGQRHFDVQLIGGIVLHEGKIAEMKTGEGKTLVATLPAYLNSLTGNGVHVITVNDYLARRDAQWMSQVYDLLGVSVGVLQHESSYVYDASVVESDERGMERLRRVSRAEAYAAGITYGTNNEFGFDYLRDNMVVDLSQRAQNQRSYAIVDEVDNILIDEARTPLIISGPAEQSPKEYSRFSRVVPSLKQEDDYAVDEKHRTVALTPEGMNKLESILSVKNLYDPANFGIVHFVENALKAQVIFQRDRDYVVSDGEVVIVDEFTGRLMTGRRYSDGLHQALEAKEGVKVQRETITYATITLQNYFRLYDKLSGMTGTAATEAEEFFKIYKLEVVEIPTNMPMVRDDRPDLIYKDQKAKYEAVVKEIEKLHKEGKPALVGTTDIDKSELLSDMLKRKGVPHEVLNAKQHEREASIVAQAGRPGAITVATNMAGRGTDIILGGNPDALDITPEEWEEAHKEVMERGGLHIIGTERHEARRIDNQLRGRAGRQGDVGSTKFFVALDDDLMRRFGGDRIRGFMEWAGLEDDVPIENKMISKSLESAQIKVEAYHFDIRKQLVEYDDVINTHRDVIYTERNKVLSGADLKSNIQTMVENELIEILSSYLSERMPENWDTEGMLKEISGVLPPPPDMRDIDAVADMSSQEMEDSLLDYATELYDKLEEELTAEVMRNIERQVMLRVMDSNWVQHLTSMENLRQGIGLHAFGQRDPLVMYKKEGHEMFQGLQSRIQHDIVHTIYHIGVTASDTNKARGGKSKASGGTSVMARVIGTRSREAVTDGGRKIGRNDQCPCGSGKKYKKCHGKAA